MAVWFNENRAVFLWVPVTTRFLSNNMLMNFINLSYYQFILN